MLKTNESHATAKNLHQNADGKTSGSNNGSAKNSADEMAQNMSIDNRERIKARKKEAQETEMKTPVSVACENPKIDFDKWIPYPPELIHFLSQLKEMKEWISKYGKAWEKVKDEDIIAVGEIGDLLNDLCFKLCELTSLEIGASYYWGDDKSEIVETLKTA